MGRRERSKAEKLERIMAAASALFAERGVEEVTTQQVADAADIGTGTLFLYARSKGELLLMVQNAHYGEALATGRAAAAALDDRLDAVMALLTPVIACNRAHVGNGRTYLREMVFGDADDPHRAEALRIVGETEESVAGIVARDGTDAETARRTAQLASAAMLLVMTGAPPEAPVTAIAEELRATLALLIG